MVGTAGAQDGPRQDRRIIDVHLHALPTSSFPPGADSLIGYDRPASGEAVMRQTIQQLQRFGVEKAITSGPPELLAKYKQAAPDRVIRSLWVPIGLTGDSLRTYLDSLSAWHEQGRFEVIGEVLTQYSGIAPSDSVLDPLWEFAEREGVPVGIHAGPGGLSSAYRVRYGDPLAFEEVLAEHPDLKVYLMHAGYPKLDNMIALLSAYPQVYVDLGFLPIIHSRAEFNRYLEGLVRAGHADRILFGSDQQIWPQSYEASVEAIENADFLAEEQKQAIFYENAARLFDMGSKSTGDS
jgi:predicted TIM-barrel fold metal-dependent hydrolase